MTLQDESQLYVKIANMREQLVSIIEKKHKIVHEALLNALDILCKEKATDESRETLKHFLDRYEENINKCYIEYCT